MGEASNPEGGPGPYPAELKLTPAWREKVITRERHNLMVSKSFDPLETKSQGDNHIKIQALTMICKNSMPC